jgi:hypothetical protein
LIASDIVKKAVVMSAGDLGEPNESEIHFTDRDFAEGGSVAFAQGA